MLKVGAIGMGRRLTCGVTASLLRLGEDVQVTAIADPNPEYSKGFMKAYHIPIEPARFYPSAEEMLRTEKNLDGIMIGTRCYLHPEMMRLAAQANIPVFLEKPVFIDEKGKEILKNLQSVHEAPVEVSFPLRMTQPAQLARDIVRSGALGRIAQVEAINTPPYGEHYFKKWHREDALTGGLFMQKATHDLDIIFFLTDSVPLTVCAMESRNVFGGDMPKGSTCDTCEKLYTCKESHWMLENRFHESPQPHTCVFSKDVEIHDAGSVLLQLSNGAHASYAQCFTGRRGAALRLTRIVGFNATLELEFVSGEVRVFHHHSGRVDRYQFKEAEGHFGGDEALMNAFVKLMRGERTEYPDLRDGRISASACLAAKRSAQTEKFVKVEW